MDRGENCVPKGIVGDQAFFTPQFMSYYKFHGITPYQVRILVDLGLLGLIEPLCVCSSVLGPSWLRLWPMKGMQRGLLSVRQ